MSTQTTVSIVMFFWERLHWFLGKSKRTGGEGSYKGRVVENMMGANVTVRQIGDLELTD